LVLILAGLKLPRNAILNTSFVPVQAESSFTVTHAVLPVVLAKVYAS